MTQQYNLTEEEVDRHVVYGLAGVYLLLKFNTELGRYDVQYVGRSDSNLNVRLKQHCSEEYGAFRFEYAFSAEEAYRKECSYYHFFGGNQVLDNEYHPDAPKGLAEKVFCPYCIGQ